MRCAIRNSALLHRRGGRPRPPGRARRAALAAPGRTKRPPTTQDGGWNAQLLHVRGPSAFRRDVEDFAASVRSLSELVLDDDERRRARREDEKVDRARGG